MRQVVQLSKKARQDLLKIPSYIRTKFWFWVAGIEREGLEEIRKIPGYHDEPLKGDRSGQRSVRLNRSYRAIYELRGGQLECVSVMEVNKHEY